MVTITFDEYDAKLQTLADSIARNWSDFRVSVEYHRLHISCAHGSGSIDLRDLGDGTKVPKASFGSSEALVGELFEIGRKLKDYSNLFNILEACMKQLGDLQVAYPDCMSAQDFQSMVQGALSEGIQPIELANELAVSPSTVQMWSIGNSAPHPKMREPVQKAIERIRKKDSQ